MADKTAIEWTDSTWNPIRARNIRTGKVGWYCEHATTGCEFCYSERRNKWIGTGLPFKPGHRKDIELFVDETMLTQPLRWEKRRMIFVCSMTDLFADFVADEWIDRMFAVMALTPQHTYQVLTKRAERMRDYITDPDDGRGHINTMHRVWDAAASILKQRRDIDVRAISWDLPGWPLPNIWLGVSAERQQEYDERKEHLRNTPAAKRFFSMEPLLGPILADWLGDWVIAGGESGPKARPIHVDWVRSLRDQCANAGVPFFKKQWGEWLPWSQFTGAGIDDDPEQTRFATREWDGERWNDVGRPMWCETADGEIDDEQCVGRIGKARAGRLLDGVEHNDFPTRGDGNGI